MTDITCKTATTVDSMYLESKIKEEKADRSRKLQTKLTITALILSGATFILALTTAVIGICDFIDKRAKIPQKIITKKIQTPAVKVSKKIIRKAPVNRKLNKQKKSNK